VAFRFDDRRLTDLTKLMQYLADDENDLAATDLNRTVWFRGLPSSKYGLIPTMFRRGGPKLDDEIHMMNLFKQSSHEFVQTQLPTNEWEWMFLMRHHNLPSRLLDWSESPLIGLFFAAAPPSDPGADIGGALWCLLPSQLNQWSLGWPSGVHALPMLTDKKAEWPLPHNEAISYYLPSERRRPRPADQPLPPAAGISVRTTKRLQAQLGVFTIHADNSPLEEVDDQAHIWRYVIPAKHKPKLREQLSRLGITRRTIFPELDSVAIDVRKSLGLT
jgi:hypothetical protein